MIDLRGRSNRLANSSQAFAFCSRLQYAFELEWYKQGLFCHQSISFSNFHTFNVPLKLCHFQFFYRQSRDNGEVPDWRRASKHFRRQKTCRRRVADEGIPAQTSRQDSSATICLRQLVFNIKHVCCSRKRQKLDKNCLRQKRRVVRVHTRHDKLVGDTKSDVYAGL